MNILILGLGSIGQRHLRNIIKIDKNIEIYAFRRYLKTPTLNNKNQILKKSLNEKYNIKYVSSLNNVKKFGIKAAIICTPSSFHVKEAIILVKQGISIFVEKPLSSNLNGIKKLKDLIKSKNVIGMMGYQLKFCPIINKLRDIILSKKYGKPKYVYIHHGEHIKNFHKYENYNNLYASKRKLGGGVILTQIHEIDYLFYIFYNFDLIKVNSFSGKLTNLKIDVEDTLISHFILKKNNNRLFGSLHLNYYEIPRKRKINIIFENSKISADLVDQKIKIYSENKTKILKLKYERNDLFLKEMKYFLDKIKDNKKINKVYSIDNGIMSLKIALKLKSKQL